MTSTILALWKWSWDLRHDISPIRIATLWNEYLPDFPLDINKCCRIQFRMQNPILIIVVDYENHPSPIILTADSLNVTKLYSTFQMMIFNKLFLTIIYNLCQHLWYYRISINKKTYYNKIITTVTSFRHCNIVISPLILSSQYKLIQIG